MLLHLGVSLFSSDLNEHYILHWDLHQATFVFLDLCVQEVGLHQVWPWNLWGVACFRKTNTWWSTCQIYFRSRPPCCLEETACCLSSVQILVNDNKLKLKVLNELLDYLSYFKRIVFFFSFCGTPSGLKFDLSQPIKVDDFFCLCGQRILCISAWLVGLQFNLIITSLTEEKEGLLAIYPQ